MAIRLRKLFKKSSKEQSVFCTAVVAAAGSSTRMEGQNKLYIDIGGKPVLAHTLQVLNKSRDISEIIVVTREQDMNKVAQLCMEYCITKISKVIAGGDTRLESVYRGVMQAAPESKLIAIQDGARPFITEHIISETVKAAIKNNAAVPAIPITSTIKEAKKGVVEKTIDRRNLYEVQTPQIFATELIKGALTNALDKSLYITDDCMAVEALGCPVILTKGARDNIKITTAEDVVFAEAIDQIRRTMHENRTRV